jgi:hypothetical protein
MAAYQTLAELKQAVDSGVVTGTLYLDNDSTNFYGIPRGGDPDNEYCLLELHPDDLLEQALDLLGLAHEHV